MATAVVSNGWSRDVGIWDTWVGLVQKLVTVVGVAGAAYWAYRRFVAGGGELAARCDVEVSAAVTRAGDEFVVLAVDVSAKNEGSVDLELPAGSYPVVRVSCLDRALLEQGARDGVYAWSRGAQLVGLPFRSPAGERDHDGIEPGSTVRSSVAVPVPAKGGPDAAFLVRFLVQARSAGVPPGDEHRWLADTVVFDAEAERPAKDGEQRGDEPSQAER